MRNLNKHKPWVRIQVTDKVEFPQQTDRIMGSGCGSVGRVFAPDIRGLWFEYSCRQNSIRPFVQGKLLKRLNVNKKRPGIGPPEK